MSPWRRVLAAPLGVVILATCMAPAGADEPRSVGFVKGHSWGWVGVRGEYASPAAADSMKKLADTGAEWVCISFATTMPSSREPEFTWADRHPAMVADDEIRRAIDLARANNLKVILKPVVNCADVWRAWIKFYRPVTDEERARGVTGELDPWGDEPVMRDGEVRNLAKWQRWWELFDEFLLHYARIAAEKDVEMFCLGCEMSSTEEFEDRWRRLIGRIRGVYRGALTYDVNHDRKDEIRWWDAVDVIGISAYYQIPPPDGQTEDEAVQHTTDVAEIRRHLGEIKERLARMSRRWNRPILFIETGCTNVRGCARHPWSHPDERQDRPLDETEQANYYQAMFETFWDEPWFAGFAWWDWPAHLYDRDAAATHRGFCVYGKRAEELVRDWYAKPR